MEVGESGKSWVKGPIISIPPPDARMEVWPPYETLSRNWANSLVGSVGVMAIVGRFVRWQLVRFGVWDDSQAIGLTEPPSQIDRAASLAAKRQRGRRILIELTLTNRTTHGILDWFTAG
jgi:hypothetical protein